MNNTMDVSYDQIFIDGAWTAPSSSEKIPVVDPSTEEAIGHVPAGNARDIDLAVTAARRAFDEGPWPRMSGAARAQVLRRIATLLREKAGALARLEVLDTGKPLPEADWDISDSAGCFDYFAGLAEAMDSEKPERIAVPDARFIAEVVKEPLGVVAAITPWNNPLLMLSWKVAPALAAGCTVVAKPSEFTSLTALGLAEIAREAGVMEGALNIVTGTGPAAGQPLSQHPLVDKTTFTGSVPTGAKVMNAAAADIKKIGLELGGKSALIMFEDADLENAVEWILFGVFWNQGQICSATTRALIHHSIYEKVVARVVEEARKIRIGNGLDSTTQLGPLVSSVQYQKVVAAVENAKREGAKVLTGGRRPPGFAKGYYFEPTILADAPLDGKAWNDEIFGPVLCVRPFETEAEAIKLANDSKYGLAGAVMTADEERAARVANALRVGVAWINCSQPAFLETPWGGYKQSGIGREMGRWGFDSYRETKQILRFRKGERWGWYLK